jgi:hypothetical protein
VVGIVSNYTGNIRHGFYVVLIAVLIPITTLGFVDVNRGKAESEAWGRRNAGHAVYDIVPGDLDVDEED